MLPSIKRYLAQEATSGIFLFATAILSMLLANSAYSTSFTFLTSHLLFIINEGLMAIFFLVIGLELKRGWLEGQFSQAILPLVAAAGGMVVPALIYVAINHANPTGWAIPVATDIAFALGVLSLFGQRVPIALKLFLLALAIFDDIGAILIIALFYSQSLAFIWLGGALLLLIFLYGLNYYNVRYLIPYLLLGVGLWCCLLYSGVHPTLAGVFLALMVPPDTPLESKLHPWVAFLIMPLFALVNAGFALETIRGHSFMNLVVLGTALGLLVGKQVGVFGFSWLLIRCKWAKLPAQTSWLAFYGVALLCGIGFTMSLFLGTLSFANNDFYLEKMRLGVMLGSLASGVLGALILRVAFRE
jgi:NhaA family Na+:H+ antiporter